MPLVINSRNSKGEEMWYAKNWKKNSDGTYANDNNTAYPSRVEQDTETGVIHAPNEDITDILQRLREQAGLLNGTQVASAPDFSSLADSILGYGNAIANAQLQATNSANALQKEMWTQGEANTDRRLADQYAFNADQAQKNRDFQAAQSQAVMDWEAGMSNTAHQREVADLKAAGLNPVLSANAGASTPTVSTPSGSTASGSAIAGNHFQGHQANIIGAYSTAGQFIAEYLGLLQNDAHFNREMDLQESNAKWSHALGIINAITGGLTSAIGLGIQNKFANSSSFRSDAYARDVLYRSNLYDSKAQNYDSMAYYRRKYYERSL